MSRQVAIEGYGTVEMSDEQVEQLNRGETVSLDLFPKFEVSDETHDLYFGKGHEAMMANFHVNPECRDGKHLNCGGDAWDDAKDRLTDCECFCHNEDGEVS